MPSRSFSSQPSMPVSEVLVQLPFPATHRILAILQNPSVVPFRCHTAYLCACPQSPAPRRRTGGDPPPQQGPSLPRAPVVCPPVTVTLNPNARASGPGACTQPSVIAT